MAEELIAGLQPVADVISPILIQMSILVGGLFGLYVILIALRVYFERRKVRLLQDIRYDLDKLNMHYGISASMHREGWIKRWYKRVKNHFEREKDDEPKKKRKKK